MKIGMAVCARNDNYGGNLKERATYCLNSAIDTFDEIFYVDWNSENGSLLWDIHQNIKFKGNLHHVTIDPHDAQVLTQYDMHAQKVTEVLARNIGIRRLIETCDWVVSSNIDIIHPLRPELEKVLETLDPNTFYTISRRHTDWEQIKGFYNGEIDFKDWRKLRDFLIENSEERHFDETAMNGDDYSIINCCGDFQIASADLWRKIRGFEEELIYSLYADTNVQKKAVEHGFGLKAIYEPALFHIEHGKGGGGFLDGINKKTNDPRRAIINQKETRNPDTWGFNNLDVEYETL